MQTSFLFRDAKVQPNPNPDNSNPFLDEVMCRTCFLTSILCDDTFRGLNKFWNSVVEKTKEHPVIKTKQMNRTLSMMKINCLALLVVLVVVALKCDSTDAFATLRSATGGRTLTVTKQSLHMVRGKIGGNLDHLYAVLVQHWRYICRGAQICIEFLQCNLLSQKC
jgi:hypothetical protein